jgi:hypothetical protein
LAIALVRRVPPGTLISYPGRGGNRAGVGDRRSSRLASADGGLGCSSACSRDAVDRESGARRRETPRLSAQSRCWTAWTGWAFVDDGRLTHNPATAGVLWLLDHDHGRYAVRSRPAAVIELAFAQVDAAVRIGQRAGLMIRGRSANEMASRNRLDGLRHHARARQLWSVNAAKLGTQWPIDLTTRTPPGIFWRMRGEVRPPAAYPQFRLSMAAVCKPAPFFLTALTRRQAPFPSWLRLAQWEWLIWTLHAKPAPNGPRAPSRRSARPQH